MYIKELIGTTITNIYSEFGEKDGWLDTSENLIEINEKLLISIPYGFDDEEVVIEKLTGKAKSIFTNLDDFPFYHLDEKGRPTGEITYQKNKLRFIQNRKIKDILYYNDWSEKSFLLLENGYLISETKMSPSGTGLAGINCYETFDSLIERKGKEYNLLSRKQQ
jgi:hypothetical protein